MGESEYVPNYKAQLTSRISMIRGGTQRSGRSARAASIFFSFALRLSSFFLVCVTASW
jgi:hypothetical protein